MNRENHVLSQPDKMKNETFDGLRRITLREIPAAADVLADAFQNDEFNIHLFPDAETRHKAFLIVYRTMLNLMFYTAEIHATSENMEGVLVTSISRRKGKQGKNANHTRIQKALGVIRGILIALAIPIRIARITKLGDLLRRSREVRWSYKRLQDSYKRYEPDLPYISLDMIAVRPELQGNGWMGRMMRPLLENARNTGCIVVLNTETPDNVPIYEHYGFKVDERIEVFPETLEYKVMSWRSSDGRDQGFQRTT